MTFLAKPAVFLLCLLPGAYLAYAVYLAFSGGENLLGPDPAQFLSLETGEWAIRLLILSLAITPLRYLLNWPYAFRFRRMIGLFAYLCVYASTGFSDVPVAVAMGSYRKGDCRAAFHHHWFCRLCITYAISPYLLQCGAAQAGKKLETPAQTDLYRLNSGCYACHMDCEIQLFRCGFVWQPGALAAGIQAAKEIQRSGPKIQHSWVNRPF